MQEKVKQANGNWQKAVNSKPLYSFIDSIRNIGGDSNNDSKYLRGLGWFEQSGLKTPPEWSYSIIQLTISGKGILMHHGKRYELPKGSGFLVHSADSAVSYYNPCESDHPWQFLYLEIFGESMRKLTDEISEKQSPVFNFSVTNELILELSSFQNLSTSKLNISPGDQQLWCGKLRKIIIDGLSGQQRINNLTVEKALDNLSQNDSIQTVNDLAKQLKISREYLSRQFKKTLNTSPYQYILRHRLSSAVALINNSTLSIKEIAFKLGFSSTTAFGRQFKQIYGITPSSLRRNNKK